MLTDFLRLAPRRALMVLVRAYRLLLSPWLGSSCRYEPSCSAYSLQALDLHGAAAGTYLTVHRLLRCAPWCEGGHDPVPPQPLRLFRYLSGDAAAPAATSSSPSTSRPNP